MEAVGRLAGGVAHDFNNLLTVIKGNAELALADLDSKDAVREELEEVERAAERASSLTRQLLAFSRKQILKPRRLALNELVVELGRMLRRTVGEDIELKIVLDPTLGAVRADPGQIEQVLLNLVVNARDAMPRGGALRIETRNASPEELRHHGEAEEGAYVALIVADTGTGMPEDVRERVFEPFFTTKEQGKGTGLGLSTVYGSVKQSGGYVVVESVVGSGSTFAIYLPRVDTVDEMRTTGEMEAIPRGSATVLLVEDEDAVRRLGSRVLLRSGYTVLTASCGDEALEVAAEHVGTIDLLMTDVVMPGMSGRELAERLVPLRPGMRLLYASGYTEDAIIRHGVSSQQTAFLEKPFTPHGLLRKVREVLDAPAPDAAAVQLAS
jgi:CheY-like chemotaxis protein